MGHIEYPYTGKLGLKRFGRGEGDSDRVTKHQVEAEGGLEGALRALQLGKVDVKFLQETNLTKGIHTHHRAGYTLWDMKVDIRHRGGVAVARREKAGWQVECIENTA